MDRMRVVLVGASAVQYCFRANFLAEISYDSVFDARQTLDQTFTLLMKRYLSAALGCTITKVALASEVTIPSQGSKDEQTLWKLDIAMRRSN